MSLQEVWQSASGSPFYPAVPKEAQFNVGFGLVILGFIFTGLFGLNRSVLSIFSFGVPASLAFGFGAVYLICAAGVYV